MKRFWEIDAARGIAIVMMIAYHVMFDANYFGIAKLPIYSLPVVIFARSIPVIFITVSGIALYISYSRRKAKGNKLFPHYAKRAAMIFGWGLIITAASWVFVPQGTILFGILHFIGLSILIAYPFLGKDANLLLLAAISIAAGFFLMSLRASFPYLLWLGIPPSGFYTFDYFPVFPWIGFTFIGIHIGKALYRDGKRRFEIKDAKGRAASFFSFLGRHSLFIYLVHQLVIIGVLYLLFL